MQSSKCFTSARWKQKRLWLCVPVPSTNTNPQIPPSNSTFHFFYSPAQIGNFSPPTSNPPVSGGDFSARPISSIGPPSIQTTPPHHPMPSPPLALLFHTLPVHLVYPPTPGPGLSPHQCLCASLIRRTAPAVAIRVESCREPESKLCRNQKAILTLLNLPALFITTTERTGVTGGQSKLCLNEFLPCFLCAYTL